MPRDDHRHKDRSTKPKSSWFFSRGQKDPEPDTKVLQDGDSSSSRGRRRPSALAIAPATRSRSFVNQQYIDTNEVAISPITKDLPVIPRKSVGQTDASQAQVNSTSPRLSGTSPLLRAPSVRRPRARSESESEMRERLRYRQQDLDGEIKRLKDELARQEQLYSQKLRKADQELRDKDEELVNTVQELSGERQTQQEIQSQLVEAQVQIDRLKNEWNQEHGEKKNLEIKVNDLTQKVSAMTSAFDGMKTVQGTNDKKLAEHRQEMADLKNKAENEKQKQKLSHERKIGELQAKIKAVSHEKNSLITDYTLEKGDLQRSHKAQLETKDKNMKEAMNQLKSDHSAQMTKVTQECELAITQLQTAHTATAALTRREYEGQMFDMIKDHSDKITSLNQEYTDEVNTLEQNLEKTQKEADEKLQRLENEMTKERDDLVESHKQELARLQQEYRVKEAKLISDHEENTRQLSVQVQELNDALLSRDIERYQASIFGTSSLPSKSDGKLRDQFVMIQQLVDELSRLPWSDEQQWWTESVFKSLRGRQQSGRRALKKAILQHTIWTSLFEFVFRNPFQVFGEQGHKLSAEWSEQESEALAPSTDGADELWTIAQSQHLESLARFSSGGSSHNRIPWPVASAQAERWRYMTIKECRDSLTQNISEHDPRAPVKRGFMVNQAALVEELKTRIHEVVALEKTRNLAQSVEKLCKKAAGVWLDFAMHRCRIVIAMMAGTNCGITSQANLITQLRNGGLMLTVSPMLGRYGNVRGAELENLTTIDEGAKEFLEIA